MGFFRNFDNRDRYSDLDGKPLHGCIQFNVKDGNTPTNIYDADKVPLANPQLTDNLGRTRHQVFIDADCVAYMYKYIGQGSFGTIEEEGIDPSDESKWELQYSVENAALDERSVAGDAAMAVNTMAELRGMDPYEVPEIGGVRVITLYGYFECGDKEPINYIWEDESEQPDDNGACIAVDGMLTGRWVMVRPTEHCDSRHFGVFPQDSYNASVDHTTGITQLVDYCNRESLRPFFNGSMSYPYFKYAALAVNSKNPIDVSDGTVFVDATSSMFYGEWNGNPYFRNAATTVNAKTVRHSWHFANHVGTETYIIDSRQNPALLSNVHVVLEVSPASGTQLVDCELDSNEKITDSIVLQDMTVKTDWFADNYSWSNLLMVNCKVLLDNCKDANTYVLLKNKLHEADYGDLGEQTLSNTTLLANCIAENAAFSNVTLTGDTELHNVSGTVTVNGAAYQLNFVDCWLTIQNTSQVVLSNIMWRRGAVSCSARIQPLTTLYLDSVEVMAPFYTPGVNAQMYRCTIRTEQHLYRQVQVVNSTVFAPIYQYPEQFTFIQEYGPAYYWCGEYFGNTFLDNSRIYLAPIPGADYSDKDLGLNTKICNNMSDHNFVDDTLWNGVTKHGWQTRGEFRYQGNTGGCPVYEEEKQYSIPYGYLTATDSSEHVEYGQYCSNVPGTTNSTGLWVVRDARTHGEREIAYDVYWVLNFKDFALDTSKLFKLPYLVGSTFIDVDCDITAFIRPDGYSNWPFYTSTFRIASTLLDARESVGAGVAYVNSYRPIKLIYTGIRYCDNDQIDEMMSSLTQCLWAYTEHPGNFGFACTAQIRYKAGGISTGVDGYSHTFGKTTTVE